MNINEAPIGALIKFAREKNPYRVRARSGRFIVCTKPFAPQKTVMYTVIDLVEQVRGTENLVFGMGAESDQSCWDMVDRLDGRDGAHPQGRDAIERPKFAEEMKRLGEKMQFQESFRTEVSHRNRVPLDIESIKISKSCRVW